MNTRLTLVFVCDQPHLYTEFLTQFQAANFQILIAHSNLQAKSILLTQSVTGIVLCHDYSRDDRALATQLKRISPDVPVFLLTNRQQPRPADVDSIWRAQIDDAVALRGMAMFFRHVFNPRQVSLKAAVAGGEVESFVVSARAMGS